jgi:uncharacterized protein (DUF342 family)
MEIVKTSQSSIIGVVDEESENRVTTTEVGNPLDGRFEITLSQHDILATCNFFPTENPQNPIREDVFTLYLDKLNITYGINWNNIDEAIRICNLDRSPVYNVVIAEGIYPENDVAEYYELNPRLNASQLPEDTSEQIDYKNYTPFVVVKKDQPLAILRRHVEGKDGHDLHDSIVPYKIIVSPGYASGENTRAEGQFILANIHGQLVETKRVLAVRDTLIVNGPVGYQTGHISFPGDIIISGPVSDGFRIYSGKSLTIKQTFDVTETITKTDLTVSGGIIGRGQALVKVGGTLKTRFIDNCRVACRRNVYVIKEIVNSNVYALGAVDLGEKGILLGSSVYSLNGLRAKSIGRKNAKATNIYCGIDFTIMQDKVKSTTHLKDVALKLGRYRNLLEAMDEGAAKRKSLEEAIAKHEQEQKNLSAHISELMGKINSNDKAVVEVSGEIAPGTYIEICQIGLMIDETLRRVRIKLDRDLNKLVVEKI